MSRIKEVKPLDNMEDFIEKQAVTKSERFHKVAGGRIAQALRAIELIGNCANKQLYEYTSEEIQMAFDQIRESTREAEKKFFGGPRQKFGRNFFGEGPHR